VNENEKINIGKDGEEIPAEKEGRGGRLMLIFCLLGALAVGGGGTFYYTTQMAPQNGEALAVEEETEPEPGSEETLDSRYLKIERLPAAITDARGSVVGYVFLDFNLETRNTDEQPFVSERLPVLVNAFNKEISTNGITDPNKPGAIDYGGSTARLKDVANTILGKEMIYGVFITKSLRTPG